MASTGDRIGRLALLLVGAIVAGAAGVLVFVLVPDGNLARLFGVVLALGAVAAGVRLAGGFARSVFATYNVARVSVEGPIARRPGGGLPPRPTMTTADDVVELIELADADDAVRGLVVHLNTPGGEVVPSEDIRAAVEAFDGPTVAYATDTCASGGYWIASGCDHMIAREGSIVGSIGVIASRVTGDGLLERLGLSYERLVAGEFKDAGTPFRSLDDDERAYLQGIVDDYYGAFVDRVAAGRDLDEEAIRETEARVFLGEEALDIGLVDELGDEEAVEEWLESAIGEVPTVQAFEPSVGLAARLGLGAERVAYAFGAGVSSAFGADGDAGTGFRFR